MLLMSIYRGYLKKPNKRIFYGMEVLRYDMNRILGLQGR